MLHLDRKYISLVSIQLDKFKKQETVYNFRCPYCGDSKKNKNRARGYFFQKKGSYIYKCHNCGVGRTLPNFLNKSASGPSDNTLCISSFIIFFNSDFFKIVLLLLLLLLHLLFLLITKEHEMHDNKVRY